MYIRILLVLMLLSITNTLTAGDDVKSFLSSKSFTIMGTFSSYDFEPTKDNDPFDWVFTMSSSGKSYQLQGDAPDDDNVFGWKEATVTPPSAQWYMFSLGEDVDGDGSVKFDWILVSAKNQAIYKLAGVKDDGTFDYSDRIVIDVVKNGDKLIFENLSNEIEKLIDSKESAVNALSAMEDGINDIFGLSAWLNLILNTSIHREPNSSPLLKTSDLKSRAVLRSLALNRGVYNNETIECLEAGTMLVNGPSSMEAMNIVIDFNQCYMDAFGYLSGQIHYQDSRSEDLYTAVTEFIDFIIDTGLASQSTTNGTLTEQFIGEDKSITTFTGTTQNSKRTSLYTDYVITNEGTSMQVEGKISKTVDITYPCRVGIYNVETLVIFEVDNDLFDGVVTINNAQFSYAHLASDLVYAYIEYDGKTVNLLVDDYTPSCND
ncbi:MAG: hypothetical protein U9P71_05370 [Campylobacterota bacterium]|nr:hypothetical protein [Campylobacterota bacterium]